MQESEPFRYEPQQEGTIVARTPKEDANGQTLNIYISTPVCHNDQTPEGRKYTRMVNELSAAGCLEIQEGQWTPDWNMIEFVRHIESSEGPWNTPEECLEELNRAWQQHECRSGDSGPQEF